MFHKNQFIITENLKHNNIIFQKNNNSILNNKNFQNTITQNQYQTIQIPYTLPKKKQSLTQILVDTKGNL